MLVMLDDNRLMLDDNRYDNRLMLDDNRLMLTTTG